MREFRFRAWDKESRKLFVPTGIQFADDGTLVCIDYDSIVPFGSIILMQYTGFKDKNGQEIYYGDIYIHQSLGLKRVVDELEVAYWLIDEDRMNNPMETVEIIGNIYENPELLNFLSLPLELDTSI